MNTIESIIAAPGSNDTEALYRLWRRDHIGSHEDFYRFMMWPSAERTFFMQSAGVVHAFDGNVMTTTVKYQS